MNNRRKLIIALGTCTLTVPLFSFAQQQRKVWRVGFLAQRHVNFVDSDSYYGPFTKGMRDLGYVEGKNLVIEWRSAEGSSERLPGLAEELVNLKMDVIVAVATPATSAAQRSTTKIPIVMVSIGDPVSTGFVKSLARPEGNITGVSNMSRDIRTKQIEMLLGMVPKLPSLTVLINPSNRGNTGSMETIQAAGEKLHVKILRADAQTPQEIENAFFLMRQQNAGALLVSPDPLFQQQRSQIVELAAKHRLPCIATAGDYVEAGGLMSYGPNYADHYQRAATYVDKILKGAKPGDLPVEQPMKLELVINRKTARALGLKIPQSLLIMADKIIDQ